MNRAISEQTNGNVSDKTRERGNGLYISYHYYTEYSTLTLLTSTKATPRSP